MKCNAIFLCFVAMMSTIVSLRTRKPKPKPHKWEKNALATVGCHNNTHYLLRNAISQDSACNLKEVLLILAPPTVYEAVDPGVAWVKRCVGDCDTSEDGFTCRPHDTQRRNIPITLYNVKTDQKICSTYTVEDHVTCRCESPQSTCAPTGANVELDLSRTGTVHPGLAPTSVWFKRCAGKCAEYDKRCVPQSAVIKEVVAGKGVYTAEEHTSCGCAPEEFMGPCEAAVTFITVTDHLAPLYAVKRCRGKCLNPGYECTPVKTRLIDLPNTQKKWLEHVECFCAKLMG